MTQEELLVDNDDDDDDSKPSASNLDQEQLKSIGCDIAKLHDFKSRLDAALAKEEAGTTQHTTYTYLMGQVDARLFIITTNHDYGNNALWSPTDLLPLSQVLKTKTTSIGDGSEVAESSGLAKMDAEYEIDDVSRPLDNNTAIQMQKSWAMRQLNELARGRLAPTMATLLESIQTLLEKGRVKPIFHGLLLPETFLTHHLSIAEVTVGEADNEQIVMELESFGDNLDDAVPPNGRAARFVKDDGLKSTWKYHQKLAAFAVMLVNADAKMLGEGIECTTLQSIPIKINPGDTSYLLTRPESRGVVRDIFWKLRFECKSDFVAAITGVPGIGKSWTLFYALQQALLYEGANVLFFFQKRRDVVLYLRRNNKIYAWYSEFVGDADSTLFNRSDVLVLLDPKEADRGGAQFASGEAKLVYAASNNKVHISNDALKNSPGMLAFLGPPLDNELPVILKCLDSALPEQMIADRQQYVGNLVRYILTQQQHETRQAAIKVAVNACIVTPDLLDAALDVQGMSDGKHTVPGTLFKVLPKRPEDPKSMGYDGQEVDYGVRVVEAANAVVRDEILKAKRQTILSYFDKTSDDERAKMGNKVEELFILDLKNTDGMVVRRYLQKSGRNSSGGESTLEVGNGNATHPNEDMKDMRVICTEVLNQPNVVAKVAKGTALIDAAGPGRRVYQVTVSLSHKMSSAAMESLARELGFIRDNGEIVPENEVEKLEFYWVVPIGIASQWKNRAPRKYAAAKNDSQEVKDRKDLLNRVLEMHVNQYVLPMTHKSPIPYCDRATRPPW